MDKKINAYKKSRMKELGEIFAFRLKKMIDKKGWSIEYVAEKSGIPPKRIKTWLDKKINPCFDYMLKIQSVFECSYDYLLGLKDF